MARHLLMALSTPREGRTDDFHTWLDKHHIPEILCVPGFVSAQRYDLAAEQRRPPPHPYHYATLYELETDDLQGTLDALGVAVATGTKSDAVDVAHRALWVFTPRGNARHRGDGPAS